MWLSGPSDKDALSAPFATSEYYKSHFLLEFTNKTLCFRGQVGENVSSESSDEPGSLQHVHLGGADLAPPSGKRGNFGLLSPSCVLLFSLPSSLQVTAS